MAFLVSVLAGVLFGVMPLRQIFKTDPNDAIKSGGNQSFAGRRWAFRDVLLAAQIALCCVTVTAAFVALRGNQRMHGGGGKIHRDNVEASGVLSEDDPLAVG